jgi:galactitol-specific phosphotransferase system IIB component
MDTQNSSTESNVAGRKRRREANENANDTSSIDNLADLSSVGKSAKRQMKSSHKLFEKFLTKYNLPAFNTPEFREQFTSKRFGQYGTFLLETEKLMQNTALSYLSNLKGRLKEINMEVIQDQAYSRVRDQIKVKSQEAARVEGHKTVQKADAMSVEDLHKICEFLVVSGDQESLSARLLLILQFQAFGRISECVQTVLSDLGFNTRTGSIEIDWTRSKTASSGRYNIFVDSMHFERDFLHALASFFVMQDHTSLKLFPNCPESSSSAYVNNMLKTICEQLSIAKDLKSHSSRRGASTHAGSDPGIQAHWIAERGSWLLDNISRVFLYIQSTSANDARVARSLSCWKDVNSGGAAPTLSTAMTDEQKQELCYQLFKTAAPSLNTNLMNSMAASLLMYLDDVKERNIVIYEKIAECLEDAGYDISTISAMSKEIRLRFISENILFFPKESPLLRGGVNNIEQIKIPISDIKEHLESSLNLQTNILTRKKVFVYQKISNLKF